MERNFAQVMIREPSGRQPRWSWQLCHSQWHNISDLVGGFPLSVHILLSRGCNCHKLLLRRGLNSAKLSNVLSNFLLALTPESFLFTTTMHDAERTVLFVLSCWPFQMRCKNFHSNCGFCLLSWHNKMKLDDNCRAQTLIYNSSPLWLEHPFCRWLTTDLLWLDQNKRCKWLN